MLTKVISGGQVGADIAGLRAAKRCGIETGGTAGKGFRTVIGPNLELKTVYGLVSNGVLNYKTRTYSNVENSDATVRIAYNFNSPGERCTLNAIYKYKKPRFDISLFLPLEPRATELAAWLLEYQIQVLNVAGNARVDIEPVVEEFLVSVFSAVNGLTNR